MVRQIDFPAKDAALRDDVRLLGAMVGEVVREQAGTALFEVVETVRRAAIGRREGDAQAGVELRRELSDLGPAQARQLVRAFSAYFQVVNLAERVHRVRRRRDYQRSPDENQRGSARDWLGRLSAAGVDAEGAQAILGRLSLEPVFTAHPTEATRRTILHKEQRIARRLLERLDPSRTPREEATRLADIRAEVTAIWQTEQHPSERPTVGDEREHILFYLNDVLYRVVPDLYEVLAEAWSAVYGRSREDLEMPTILRFASWVGGDMDGNPNVGADTIRATLARQREMVLGRYRDDLKTLARRLSQSLAQVGVESELLARQASYGTRFPEALASIRPRHLNMPYRVLLRLMVARLEATHADANDAYPNAMALADDLRLIARSLGAHRGRHAGQASVERLLRRVETFGFHLATLDVRQDAMVHRRALSALLADEEWLVRPVAERVERLRRELREGGRPGVEPAGEAKAALDVFATIASCRDRYGVEAVGPCIISMAQGVDDVLTVLLLARWGGLCEEGGSVPLDVAPLFETVPDLEAAAGVMADLFSDPLYRDHVAGRGARQIVMVGYSDSSKDGSLAASRWALQTAQHELATVHESADITLTIFHGRGGTISRGGGKTHRAVMAAPPGAVRGGLRVTEQGEVINAKFGLRGIALRSFERVAGSLALALSAPQRPDSRAARWSEVMDHVAATSRRVYRELVYESPGFIDYFQQATPIDVISRMHIGSRPASRRSGRGIEDLRAIPWVFSWTQSRHLLPGWYGLGSGLASACEHFGERLLREMAREWQFARALLDDAEMVLGKADLEIARRYAALAGPAGEQFYPVIRREFERTRERVLSLRESDELLAGDRSLARSIRLRNPYVDPMSELQAILLAEWRATNRRDDELFESLLATVNGIARGLQNTG